MQKLKSGKNLQKSNCYLDPFDLTIERYYRANDDVSFLLRERRKLNEYEIAILKEWYFEVQDWFSSQVNTVLYNKRMRDFKYIFVRERKIQALLAVKEALELLRNDLKYMEVDRLSNLNKTIKALGLPIRLTVKDQLWQIEREIKGYQNAIRLRQQKTTEKPDNWIKLVTTASKINGFRVDQKTTTLAEWVEIIKDLQNKDNGGNKTNI